MVTRAVSVVIEVAIKITVVPKKNKPWHLLNETLERKLLYFAPYHAMPLHNDIRFDMVMLLRHVLLYNCGMPCTCTKVYLYAIICRKSASIHFKGKKKKKIGSGSINLDTLK